MTAHDMTTAREPISVRVGARSERGLRPENQDRMSEFSSAMGAVYLVADGMGGHQGGAEAARMVSEGFRHFLSQAAAHARLEEVLQYAASAINMEMLRRGTGAEAVVRGMGSTVVLIALRQTPTGAEFMVGHIGDSRAYLMRDGRLRQLTSDHSMVQRLVEEQILTAEAARNHPQSNVLTRAFGQEQEVTLELAAAEPLHRDDLLMICSDGLWGYVPEEEMAQELTRSPQVETVAASLVQRALAHGSDDNITVQVIRVEGGAAARAGPPAGAADTFPAPGAPLTSSAPLTAKIDLHAQGPSSGTHPHLALWIAGACLLSAGVGAATYAWLHGRAMAKAVPAPAHITNTPPLPQPGTAAPPSRYPRR